MGFSLLTARAAAPKPREASRQTECPHPPGGFPPGRGGFPLATEGGRGERSRLPGGAAGPRGHRGGTRLVPAVQDSHGCPRSPSRLREQTACGLKGPFRALSAAWAARPSASLMPPRARGPGPACGAKWYKSRRLTAAPAAVRPCGDPRGARLSHAPHLLRAAPCEPTRPARAASHAPSSWGSGCSSVSGVR